MLSSGRIYKLYNVQFNWLTIYTKYEDVTVYIERLKTFPVEVYLKEIRNIRCELAPVLLSRQGMGKG